MSFKLISNPEAIADAFGRFARALRVPSPEDTESHDGFNARRDPRGDRDCVLLSRIGDKGTVLISACPDGTSKTKTLWVTDEQEMKYLAHSGVFAQNALDRALFKENTQDDEEWIGVAGQDRMYLITPLDGIDDAKIVANVGRFIRKRFVPNTSSVASMVGPSLASESIPLNRVLFGPPGTGKTYDAITEAVKVIDGRVHEERSKVTKRFRELSEDKRIEFVTFHQNYAYEDFIEGIRPVLNNGRGKLRYVLRDGIFKEIVKQANKHPGQPYVLIIDEINRGNIAKIFGELITLIESSKRLRSPKCGYRLDRDDIGSDQLRARLPYSRDWFGVPANLYLIGTMNTADRGIALLDVALRRRFEFVPRMPNPNHEGIAENVQGVDCRKLLKAINDRIVENFDRDHQVGHTWFLDIRDLDGLKQAFQTRIIPLLQEYFYDDWKKMRLVLNNNVFIEDKTREGAEHSVFDVLPLDDGLWQNADSYRLIYDGNSDSGTNEDE